MDTKAHPPCKMFVLPWHTQGGLGPKEGRKAEERWVREINREERGVSGDSAPVGSEGSKSPGGQQALGMVSVCPVCHHTTEGLRDPLFLSVEVVLGGGPRAQRGRETSLVRLDEATVGFVYPCERCRSGR